MLQTWVQKHRLLAGYLGIAAAFTLLFVVVLEAIPALLRPLAE